MKKLFSLPLLAVTGIVSLSLGGWSRTHAADAVGAPPSAKDLAAQLAGLQQDGSTFIKAKLETSGGGSCQIQIKSRRSGGSSDVLYQVLWPKERKGESVLLHSSGKGASFTPPDKLQTLDAEKMRQPLFGSDLSCEDVVVNFFAWSGQSLGGTETVDKVSCQILESKPGKGDFSNYSLVRTWVDLKRMVPMRVDKFSGGTLVRRIDTTQVVKVDGRHIPATLSVSRPGQTSVTEIDGSRIRRGVSYTDADFTTQGMTSFQAPSGGNE